MSETSSAPQRLQKNDNKTSFLGRYRTIIIAIACFLIVDLGVLVINFYTSFQMKDDAVGINLSGRQRMLSQRTTKALLTTAYAEYIPGADSEKAREELNGAVSLFDATLHGFRFGATVAGGDGTPVFLKAAQGPKSPQILQDASVLWDAYLKLLKPVLDNTATPQELQSALTFALTNNVTLLGHMNDLTNDLEHVADQRANRLRTVQSAGIILVLLNFIFILYKFIGQLRRADASIAKVVNENAEILDTVQEGLFLLTPDNHVGSQISSSTNQLFAQKLNPGDNFTDVLASHVSPKVLADATEYIKLLLSPHVKEQLIQSINPLAEVELTITNKLDIQEKRYLSFNFNRVLGKGEEIKHLLVTVQDVTKNVELKAQIDAHKKASQKEFNMLLKAIEADPAELQSFVISGEKTLLHINTLLRSTSTLRTEKKIREVIDEIARDMHAFKGNAAMLGLDTVADQAHQFESELKNIKESPLGGALLGEALLALPIPLGNLLSTVSVLKGLIHMGDRVVPFKVEPDGIPIGEKARTPIATVPINPIDAHMLNRLAQTIATDTHKMVDLGIVCDEAWTTIPIETTQTIREIAVQLLRNSIVHGIETPDTRVATQKNPAGQINISLTKNNAHTNAWELCISDDGTGLSVSRIREKLRLLGWFTEHELNIMDDKQTVLQIFKPNFSTASDVSLHGGRGAGLDLVKSKIKNLMMGHMKISSKPGAYTKAIISFSV